MKIKRANSGFTMIEVLTVIAIIGVVLVILMFLMRNQQQRAHDAERKADLEHIKIAFEDYYNDNDCYPPEGSIENCGSADFAPYLKTIPCDPITNLPYSYEPLENCSTGYRIYAILDDKSDPDIATVGCDGPDGCGSAWSVDFNYGIAVGAGLQGTGVVFHPIDGPVFACDSSGVCNSVDGSNPILMTCPISFSNSNCDNGCSSLANRCTGF